ncbi:MAG: WbqC family protein [Bacteroidia bacterium]
MNVYPLSVIPVSYFASVGVYAVILQSENVLFEKQENFVKQTFRSRCEIYGANGKQLLSVPVEKRGNHIPITEVRVSYKEDWQKIHWRSIVSAYRNSPYFEYYADDFQPFFDTKIELLFDLNMSLHKIIMKLLKAEINHEFTQTYISDFGENVLDLRKKEIILPGIPIYNQVFEERHGFISNLSILDLLFNSGPDALDILTTK